MRALAIALSLCAAACSRDGKLVLVTLEHAPDLVARFEGTGSVGAQSHDFALPVMTGKPSYVIGFEIPPGLSGTFHLHINALSDGGIILVARDSDVELLDGTTAMTIDLGESLPDLSTPIDESVALDFSTPPDLAPRGCTIDGGMARYTTECADGGASQPICKAGICVPCASHADCPAGICAADGSCPAQSQIAYVDSMNCAAGTKDGSSLLNAYCQINDALAAASPKPFVHVAGGGYSPITVTRTVTIVGPGVVSGNFAALSGTTPVVNFATSSVATLTLDGLSLVGQTRCMGTSSQTLRIVASQAVSPSSNNDYGVYSNGCSLEMLSTKVIGNGAGGVKIEGTGPASIIDCTIGANTKISGQSDTGYGIFDNAPNSLVVDRCLVTNNTNGGLWIFGATYSVTNNFIDSNAVGVTLGNTGVFRYNTVHDNTTMGINCAGTAAAVESSIVWHNPMNGTQVMGSCALEHVVVGSEVAAGSGKITLDPSFGSNYHLQDNAANAACCIDKGNLSSGTPPDHDFDNTARPQRTAYDIGAHELK